MKIRMTCSTSEPGVCGVGDYVRRLSGALVDLGHEVEVLAIYDKHVEKLTEAIELSPLTHKPIFFRRFPSKSLDAWHEFRERITDDWIVSYQYPGFFHYNPKGIPWSFERRIVGGLGKGKFHVMVHELWLSIKFFPPTLRGWLGYFQRHVLISWLKKVRPTLVTTNIKMHQEVLKERGVESSVLPLFGNLIKSTDEKGWLHGRLTEHNIKADWIVGVFGTVWGNFTPDDFLISLVQELEKRGHQGALVFIGQSGPHVEMISERINKRFGARFPSIILGRQSPSRIFDFLSNIKIGLAISGWGIAGKSSSVATMLDHGVPVVVTQKGEWKAEFEIDDPLLIQWSPGQAMNLESFVSRAPRDGVMQVAKQLTTLLDESLTRNY